ncbi:NAD(P)H-binding protein [Actinomadura sp. NAK00032]|uniref:NAD(P)H-binding protein n=1 Tax=Actinomadura sp. NAK00032 TaxID=2742128 RepID=UPI0015929EB0|nr:NAD(P)H-binding protein [Actinomadura sp. NAK00032]QKW32702.1 NAD(P)H-binding protein [Actinomadura sp. NAK00032]
MPDTDRPASPRLRPTILVTGATGNLGRELTGRLRERGARVLSLTRRPAGAHSVAGAVAGDLTDRAAMRAALDGVDAVFLIWPLLDSAPARGLVAELAAAAPRVVYLSSTALDDRAVRQSDPILQVHADMETLLHNAGLRPVVLRSDTLASNARGWVPQVRAGDVVSGPDVARTAVVDERDVADAAAAVLLAGHAPSEHDLADDGPCLLTGPEVLSRAEQVERLGAALGRRLRFAAVTAGTARSRMLADGRPAPLVEALIAASERRPASDLTTDHVERLTGHPARSFLEWALDHAAEFSGADRPARVDGETP